MPASFRTGAPAAEGQALDCAQRCRQYPGSHVAALVSVDAVPDLGTPRGFAIGVELGVVKTGKQFARESGPNFDRKA
jgi:hypothetical protein